MLPFRIKLPTLTAFGIVMISCSSNLKVKTKSIDGPTNGPATSSETTSQGAESSDISTPPATIESIRPRAAKPGDTVYVIGQNFSADATVILGDTKIPLTVTNTTEATFVMPDNVQAGITSLTLVDAPPGQSIKLIANTAQDQLPIMDISPNSICTDITYRNGLGNIVTGTRICESPTVANCANDGQLNCLTSPGFPAAQAAGSAAKILTGQVIAGISGTFSPDYPDPSNVRSSDTSGGVPGTLGDCASDGGMGCVTNANFLAANLGQFNSADIRNGVTIAGIVGVLSGAPSACSNDGQTGCLTNNNFKSADMTVALPSNIKASVTMAGVTGNLVVESHSACGADGAVSCVASAPYAAALTTGLGLKVVSGNTVAGIAGTVTAESHSNCNTDGDTNCVTTSSFKSASMTAALAANIKSGITIAGVTGSLVGESHNACTGNNQSGCVTSASWLSADLTNLSAGNIKSGVAIAGTTGDYPSATYPLPGADNTADLDNATFNVKVKSATGFEYWNSAGQRQLGTGDSDIIGSNIVSGVNIFGTTGTFTDPPDPWNIRAGVTINGVTGSLKLACRNKINSAIYNSDTMPPSNSATNGTNFDWWDTIDDENNGGTTLPTSRVLGWTADNDCDASVWQDVTPDGICDSSGDDCMFKDRVSGLTFTETQSTSSNWSNGVQLCDGLTFGGYSDWRLPTQKELMTAYVHGIRDIGYKGGTAGTSSNNQNFMPTSTSLFWSATSYAFTPNQGFTVYFKSGVTDGLSKNSGAYILCVR